MQSHVVYFADLKDDDILLFLSGRYFTIFTRGLLILLNSAPKLFNKWFY